MKRIVLLLGITLALTVQSNAQNDAQKLDMQAQMEEMQRLMNEAFRDFGMGFQGMTIDLDSLQNMVWDSSFHQQSFQFGFGDGDGFTYYNGQDLDSLMQAFPRDTSMQFGLQSMQELLEQMKERYPSENPEEDKKNPGDKADKPRQKKRKVYSL